MTVNSHSGVLNFSSSQNSFDINESKSCFMSQPQLAGKMIIAGIAAEVDGLQFFHLGKNTVVGPVAAIGEEVVAIEEAAAEALIPNVEGEDDSDSVIKQLVFYSDNDDDSQGGAAIALVTQEPNQEAICIPESGEEINEQENEDLMIALELARSFKKGDQGPDEDMQIAMAYALYGDVDNKEESPKLNGEQNNFDDSDPN